MRAGDHAHSDESELPEEEALHALGSRAQGHCQRPWTPKIHRAHARSGVRPRHIAHAPALATDKNRETQLVCNPVGTRPH